MKFLLFVIAFLGVAASGYANGQTSPVRDVYLQYKALFEKMEGVYPGTAECNGSLPIPSDPPFQNDNCICLIISATGDDPDGLYERLQILFETTPHLDFHGNEVGREFELDGWPVVIWDPGINPGIIVHN